uniref:RING-type domain-containing protein n=1 Tax=Oryzias latipes TaxID=8090 RepID=A0A3P9J917_ORYLA
TAGFNRGSSVMSEAWTGEDSFACPVCLDVLKDPTTLPCGHSYCLSCIQSHWDKERSKGQYSCPQCRQIFNPRPSLARSTVLAEAMEKLRTNSIKERSSTASAPSAPPSMPIYEEVLPALGPRKGSAYPQLPPVEAKLCPQHNRSSRTLHVLETGFLQRAPGREPLLLGGGVDRQEGESLRTGWNPVLDPILSGFSDRFGLFR